MTDLFGYFGAQWFDKPLHIPSNPTQLLRQITALNIQIFCHSQEQRLNPLISVSLLSMYCCIMSNICNKNSGFSCVCLFLFLFFSVKIPLPEDSGNCWVQPHAILFKRNCTFHGHWKNTTVAKSEEQTIWNRLKRTNLHDFILCLITYLHVKITLLRVATAGIWDTVQNPCKILLGKWTEYLFSLSVLPRHIHLAWNNQVN